MSLYHIINTSSRAKEGDPMNNPIPRLLDCVPTLVSNTRLHIHLEGWPAASAVASVCGTIVAIIAIVVTDRRDAKN